MSTNLDAISQEDPNGIPWRHAVCFRVWRACVSLREQILTMNDRHLEALVREYNLGNRLARHRVHLDLEDIEDPEDRKDGWRLIASGIGDQARYTDSELPLMEDGVEVGIVMAWQDRNGDLWGDVLWHGETEEQEAYETRQGKYKIDAMVTGLRLMTTETTMNAVSEGLDGIVTLGEPTSSGQPEDAATGPRMATAGHEGDGGVPWAS